MALLFGEAVTYSSEFLVVFADEATVAVLVTSRYTFSYRFGG